MLRRTVLAGLLGAGAEALAGAGASLDRFFEASRGTALLLDFRTRRLVALHGPDLARGWLVPPGSTLKPFSLLALIQAGKLTAREQFPCSGQLTVGGRSFACSHPPIGVPMDVRTAIAYSCNCFVAHFAQRFEPGELARRLAAAGFSSRTGLLGEAEVVGEVQPAATVEAHQLQALGEGQVVTTPLELLLAYHRLASGATRPEMAPILEGLEGAVEYGTAQRARISGVSIAGKTGSVRTATGTYAAWFAGFAPSRSPAVVVTVAVQGRSGGADAAPIAGRIIQAHLAGQL